MSEAELKNNLKNGGFQRADTWKPRKNGFASGSRFRKGDAPALDELIIHDMLIPLRPLNNFNASPPFGLYDIFNYLICSPQLITGSTLRSKRALTAAYSSVDLPVWRSSVRRVFATDHLRQTFMHLSLSASPSQDALRLSRDKEWLN